jgi:hypothetical protein
MANIKDVVTSENKVTHVFMAEALHVKLGIRILLLRLVTFADNGNKVWNVTTFGE